jgi:uncharacterized protein YpmB
MTGYILGGGVLLVVIAVFAAFLVGMSKGKKSERAAQAEAEVQKAKDAASYEQAKTDIMQEAFGNAEKKKAALNTGATARERFNAINNGLRNPAAPD